MRQAHYLRENRGMEVRRHRVCVDTETDAHTDDLGVTRYTLRLGCASYFRLSPEGEVTHRRDVAFRSVAEWWDWLETCTADRTRLYVYCHNTSFDLPVLDVFRVLPMRGWALKRAVIEAPPTMITFVRGRRSLKFLDTLNYFRMPLRELGKLVGIEKGVYDDVSHDDTRLAVYCRTDCDILIMGLALWVRTLGQLQAGCETDTLAAQALTLYRHRYMPPGIVIHDEAATCKLERECYYGGRTECFRMGRIREPVWMLDINSMYPFVMRSGLFPKRLRSDTSQWTISGLEHALETSLACAHVELDTPEPVYPLRRDGKLVFPVGRFLTYLTTPELAHALCRGRVKAVLRAAMYEPAALFTEYVDDLYRIRADYVSRGEVSMGSIVKKLLNSLYGKFGQRGWVERTVEYTDDMTSRTWDEYMVDTGEVVHYRQLAGLLQTLEQTDEGRDSFPAIAAHVTAEARMLLWTVVQVAGPEHVYYCDTDSVLVDAAGRGRLAAYCDSARLGLLKLEGCWAGGEIWGSKDYRLGDRQKIKGIRREAVAVSPGVWRQTKWSGLKGLLRAGDMSAPRTSTVLKHLSRTYSKGTVDAAGVVHPIQLTLP